MSQILDGTIGEALSAEALARRAALPIKPAPLTLSGTCVRLEPFDPGRDLEPLFAVSNGEPAALGARPIEAYDPDAVIWRYMFAGPFADVDAFAAYMRGQYEAPNGLCLTVFDTATERQVGICNYMTNMPEHLKVELGSIWYSPLVQRTNANLESTYLMLRHAFDLGYRRVEWKCDALNERSRRAALRMGFQFEGIQDAHFIIKNRNRDTAWYRILDREWAEVKERLERLLAT
ncbi:MAG TPA: GNAT family protein [Thermomicrobiales bacterium]|nr:GNAT family protein [Thermomicrobiales bacterium]